ASSRIVGHSQRLDACKRACPAACRTPQIRILKSLGAARTACPLVRSDSYVNACGEGVLLDKGAARLNLVAHELGEEIVGLVAFLDLHLKQRTGIDIERRLPELLRVHFAKALVALHRNSLAADGRHRLEQADRSEDRRLLALADET